LVLKPEAEPERGPSRDPALAARLPNANARVARAHWLPAPVPLNMDKYRKVDKPKSTEAAAEDEIRVTAVGSVSAYISRAAKVFNELEKPKVVIRATGGALTKAVTLTEVIKRRFKGLHQITSLGSVEIVDEYEPLEEGLDRVTDTRTVSVLDITLSKEALDSSDKGYQPPIDEALVTDFDPEQVGKGRGRGKGRGKGKGKGEKGKGKSKDKGDSAPKGKDKGKGKAAESSSKGKGKDKGKDASEPKGKGKGKDKGKDASEPKGKGKSKGKGKDEPSKGNSKDTYDKGKSKSKGYGKYDSYGDDSYDSYGYGKSSSKGKKGKSSSYGDDSYGYGKSGGKGKSKSYDDSYGYGKSGGKGKSKSYDDSYGYGKSGGKGKSKSSGYGY